MVRAKLNFKDEKITDIDMLFPCQPQVGNTVKIARHIMDKVSEKGGSFPEFYCIEHVEFVISDTHITPTIELTLSRIL